MLMLVGAAIGTGLATWDYMIDPSEPENAVIFAVAVGLGTAIGAGIGAADLDRVRWIATVELVLAGAAMCISVASLVGMYRPVRTVDQVS
jgi:hypothetical protein